MASYILNFLTNATDNNRIIKTGNCFCEISATSDGTCNMKDSKRYNLYKFDNSGK